jgi:hypothetical protein
MDVCNVILRTRTRASSVLRAPAPACARLLPALRTKPETRLVCSCVLSAVRYTAKGALRLGPFSPPSCAVMASSWRHLFSAARCPLSAVRCPASGRCPFTVCLRVCCLFSPRTHTHATALVPPVADFPGPDETRVMEQHQRCTSSHEPWNRPLCFTRPRNAICRLPTARLSFMI